MQKTLREEKTLVSNVEKRMREKGANDIETDVAERPAGAAIILAANNRKPDLVIIGGRGLSIWKGLILGSVSMAVTQRAKCPVLIVK